MAEGLLPAYQDGSANTKRKGAEAVFTVSAGRFLPATAPVCGWGQRISGAERTLRGGSRIAPRPTALPPGQAPRGLFIGQPAVPKNTGRGGGTGSSCPSPERHCPLAVTPHQTHIARSTPCVA
jgi:hypothetical protein